MITSEQIAAHWQELYGDALPAELNTNLIERQGLTINKVMHLLVLHERKTDLFLRMAERAQEGEYPTLLVKELEILEYRMQQAWKFEQDNKFHSYWFRIPGCHCPYHDNFERVGTSQRIISSGCPWHGGILTDR